jgi:3-methylfumaryl-CoA hydratase
MWAGGRVRFLAPLAIGATVRRTSEILRVEHKLGRAGELVFVTVLHALASSAGELLVREEHDIVYKDPSPPSAGGASAAASEVADAQHQRRFTPTPVMLYRYSALTFNGHRIHYDADYCREVEGYPGCVVHGPLVATLLANFAEDIGGAPIRDFTYRAMSPAFVDNVVTLRGDPRDGGLDVHATAEDGRVLMQAQASTG